MDDWESPSSLGIMNGTAIRPVGSGRSGGETAAGSADPSLSGVRLDTTALIDALRGRAAAARILQLRAAGDRPYICAISVDELFRGVKPAEEAAVTRLLNGLRVAPLGRIQGEQAGKWRRQFASRGVTAARRTASWPLPPSGWGHAWRLAIPVTFQ